MRVDAGHAPLGHLRQLEVREEGQLGEENRIEVWILRRRAAVGVEQRLRLVQVVHDRRMRREVPVGDGAHRHLRQVDVAVVVVEDVLAPIRHAGYTAAATATAAATPAACRRFASGLAPARLRGPAAAACARRRQAELTIAVEPVDVAVAPVRVGDRGDRDVNVVANLPDERRRLGREPVGQLHQHFRRASLAAVQPAHQVILRFGGRNQLSDVGRRAAARISDAGEVVAVLRQGLDVLVRRDPDDDELAVFIGLADGFNLDAAGDGGRQRPVVLQDVGVVSELRGRADVIAEHIPRRGHAVHLRQMVDERADEIRLRRPLLDRPGEVLVLRLCRVSRLGDHLLRRHDGRGKHERQAETEGPASGARLCWPMTITASDGEVAP